MLFQFPSFARLRNRLPFNTRNRIFRYSLLLFSLYMLFVVLRILTLPVAHGPKIRSLFDMPDAVDFIEHYHPRNKVYVDPSAYTVLLQPRRQCSGNELAVIYVHSSPANFVLRRTIRQTWGSRQEISKRQLLLIFTLGRPVQHRIQTSIDQEQLKYGDILQIDYIDSYRNISLKALTTLKWLSSSSCSQVPFAVKSDDDTTIHPWKLVKLLEAEEGSHNQQEQGRLLCLFWPDIKVQRDIADPWYLSLDEYSASRLPPFCSGIAYVIPLKHGPRLLAAAVRVPFFWIDDVFITGALAQEARLGHVQMIRHYAFWNTEMHSYFCNRDSGVTFIGNTPSEAIMREMWTDAQMAWETNIGNGVCNKSRKAKSV